MRATRKLLSKDWRHPSASNELLNYSPSLSPHSGRHSTPAIDTQRQQQIVCGSAGCGIFPGYGNSMDQKMEQKKAQEIAERPSRLRS
jgi:hypothetical protein